MSGHDAKHRGAMEVKEFYTAKEVAWLLRVSPKTVYRMVKLGRLRGYTFGKRLHFRHDDIMTLTKKKHGTEAELIDGTKPHGGGRWRRRGS